MATPAASRTAARSAGPGPDRLGERHGGAGPRLVPPEAQGPPRPPGVRQGGVGTAPGWRQPGAGHPVRAAGAGLRGRPRRTALRGRHPRPARGPARLGSCPTRSSMRRTAPPPSPASPPRWPAGAAECRMYHGYNGPTCRDWTALLTGAGWEPDPWTAAVLARQADRAEAAATRRRRRRGDDGEGDARRGRPRGEATEPTADDEAGDADPLTARSMALRTTPPTPDTATRQRTVAHPTTNSPRCPTRAAETRGRRTAPRSRWCRWWAGLGAVASPGRPTGASGGVRRLATRRCRGPPPRGGGVPWGRRAGPVSSPTAWGRALRVDTGPWPGGQARPGGATPVQLDPGGPPCTPTTCSEGHRPADSRHRSRRRPVAHALARLADAGTPENVDGRHYRGHERPVARHDRRRRRVGQRHLGHLPGMAAPRRPGPPRREGHPRPAVEGTPPSDGRRRHRADVNRDPACSPRPTACSPPSRSTAPTSSSPPTGQRADRDTPARIAAADAYFAGLPLAVVEGGNDAYYLPPPTASTSPPRPVRPRRQLLRAPAHTRASTPPATPAASTAT